MILSSASNKKNVLGILGFPIGHTLSPVMHQAAFLAMALPYTYLPFEVDPKRLKEAIAGIMALGIEGVNITRPHKEAVIPYLHRLSKNAQTIGAVNTVERMRDKLIGHNTDGEGFLQSLWEANIDPAGMRVILLGAGGGARAVAVSLLQQKIAELVIRARSQTRGRRLAQDLASLGYRRVKISLSPFDTAEHLPPWPTLLVNTTPLGMKRNDPLPYPPSQLASPWVVADLIYTPFKTPLLQAAEKRSLTIVPGAGMLLHQGALSFTIWTKQKAPLEVMRKALYTALSS